MQWQRGHARLLLLLVLRVAAMLRQGSRGGSTGKGGRRRHGLGELHVYAPGTYQQRCGG